MTNVRLINNKYGFFMLTFAQSKEEKIKLFLLKNDQEKFSVKLRNLYNIVVQIDIYLFS